MCLECGCGGKHQKPKTKNQIGAQSHRPGHRHEQESAAFTLDIGRSLTEKNDRLAEENRRLFRANNLLVLNVVSSPGSGKTTFIRETAARLSGKLRVGVIVGDLATDNDAARLRTAGIPVVQITTGTVCHLDAEMVSRAAAQLNLGELDVLVIENVGNLVCPADFDLGEDLRVVMLSTTEGEDKPLKYPPIFHSANVAIVTKSDLAAAAGFDRQQALSNLHRVSHHADIFELSAKTGDGMPAWLDFLAVKRSEFAENLFA
jgi:hydrogenase nickel incorporation protein HypB